MYFFDGKKRKLCVDIWVYIMWNFLLENLKIIKFIKYFRGI